MLLFGGACGATNLLDCSITRKCTKTKYSRVLVWIDFSRTSPRIYVPTFGLLTLPFSGETRTGGPV